MKTKKMGMGMLRDILRQYDKEEISISRFLEMINQHFEQQPQQIDWDKMEVVLRKYIVDQALTYMGVPSLTTKLINWFKSQLKQEGNTEQKKQTNNK